MVCGGMKTEVNSVDLFCHILLKCCLLALTYRLMGRLRVPEGEMELQDFTALLIARSTGTTTTKKTAMDDFVCLESFRKVSEIKENTPSGGKSPVVSYTMC